MISARRPGQGYWCKGLISSVEALAKRYCSLLQLRVFRPSLFQDGKVRVCVLPRSEKVLIGSACICAVVLGCEGPRQPELRQGVVDIQRPLSLARQKFSELRCRVPWVPSRQTGLAAHNVSRKITSLLILLRAS